MAKGTVASVRDGLGAAASAITEAMTAPDAMPVMPQLMKLQQAMLALIQQGHAAQQQPVLGAAGMGPGGGPFPQRPGPPPSQLPNAGGQGLFPNSPQPNPNELQALLANKAGV